MVSFQGHYAPLDNDQQINSASSQQAKEETILQCITLIYVMPTQEFMAPNDGPHTHNPDVYSECRPSPLDYPPQRSIVDRQITKQQNDTVQNEVYLPPNNTSTLPQPQNHNSSLTQQQNPLGTNDVVIQHLQQQALNQTQLNDMLVSIVNKIYSEKQFHS